MRNARKISRTFLETVFSRPRKKFRATCIVIVPPPCAGSPVAATAMARTGESLPIHARVLEEAVVLSGQKGLLHLQRNVVDSQGNPPLFAEFRHQQTVAAIDAQRNLQAHIT
jgi:hypothetical protein